MALEKANAEGLNVKMVIVADDCALPIGKGGRLSYFYCLDLCHLRAAPS